MARPLIVLTASCSISVIVREYRRASQLEPSLSGGWPLGGMLWPSSPRCWTIICQQVARGIPHSDFNLEVASVEMREGCRSAEWASGVHLEKASFRGEDQVELGFEKCENALGALGAQKRWIGL